ncbi:MAG TPA: hypothetical protein VJ724_09405 [Tahibacter sp.]|nr:hypothetical protein [Tahibacter sp.]
MKFRTYLAIAAVGLLWTGATAALTVVQPAAGVQIVAPGDDFATKELADPWDMSNAADIETDESTGITAQSIAGGLYAATTTNADAGFYPLDAGLAAGIVDLARGALHPVSTARYRHFTAKVRVTAASGPPLTQAQPSQLLFLRDGASYGNGTYGFSDFIYLSPNQWQIVTFDMVTQLHPASPHPWTEYLQIKGLRFDPNAAANVRVEVDWMRLTAVAGAAQKFTVTWSDTQGGSYTISALDAGNTAFTLATGVSGTSHAADLSKLPPGDYRIQVERAGATAQSPGTIRIAAPPLLAVTAPTLRGNTVDSYAANEVGNAWGPMDAGDVIITSGIAGIRYDNPPGTMYGRPTNGDPFIYLDTVGKAIDASYYRSLCFTLEVLGPRDVGAGSVARVFWGNATSSMTTSRDIIIHSGSREYCIEDMALLPTEPGGPIAWAGLVNYLRIDPHEFVPTAACTNSPTPENCRDFRLNSLVLSPFARTNPGYAIRWTLQDADSASATLTIALDPDRNADNNNHVVIATVPAGVGSGEYDYRPDGQLPSGLYYVRIAANDGVDVTAQYASGPLFVGPPPDRIFRSGMQ